MQDNTLKVPDEPGRAQKSAKKLHSSKDKDVDGALKGETQKAEGSAPKLQDSAVREQNSAQKVQGSVVGEQDSAQKVQDNVKLGTPSIEVISQELALERMRDKAQDGAQGKIFRRENSAQ